MRRNGRRMAADRNKSSSHKMSPRRITPLDIRLNNVARAEEVDDQVSKGGRKQYAIDRLPTNIRHRPNLMRVVGETDGAGRIDVRERPLVILVRRDGAVARIRGPMRAASLQLPAVIGKS